MGSKHGRAEIAKSIFTGKNAALERLLKANLIRSGKPAGTVQRAPGAAGDEGLACP